MTKAERHIKEKKHIRSISNLSVFAITILFSVILSPRISLYVKDGISLCYEAIIGAVFPFMIITDLVSHSLKFDSHGIVKKLFEKTFNINGQATSAFLLGAVCGFPTGVKLSADMYKRGIITKEECERLIGFSSNMGPAFIISGIGAALCGSIRTGVILYAVTLVSGVISGFLMGIGKVASNNSAYSESSDFSLTDSIKGATKSTINICGFIIFFSAVCGLLSTVIKNDFIYSLFLPFLEISNATKSISAITFVSKNAKLVAIAFSVSFSGLSIYMQAKSFFSEEKISMRPYLAAKLTSALISSLMMALIVLMI